MRVIGGTPEVSAEKRKAGEEREHSELAMLTHADSAFDLSQMLRAKTVDESSDVPRGRSNSLLSALQ